MTDVSKIVETPCCRAGRAAQIAGMQRGQIAILRYRENLNFGTETPGGWTYSPLDVAELTCSLGLSVCEAVSVARNELRPILNAEFVNLLAHGFYSEGGYEVVDDAITRRLYADVVIERVVKELQLPLPVRPFPRTPEIALEMIEHIFRYFDSPPGALRWQRWCASAIARGGVSLDQAAAELGAPFWFLRALAVALHAEALFEPEIVAAVERRAAGR
jgi:hypothetical protein